LLVQLLQMLFELLSSYVEANGFVLGAVTANAYRVTFFIFGS
jgi:hypothetical protein